MSRWDMSRRTDFGNTLFGTTLLGIAMVLAACQPSPGTPSKFQNKQTQNDPIRKLNVYAVNYPLAYFTKAIGGENDDVVLPVPANVDPALWSPEPETIGEYQRADLILLNGAGYAAWTNRATLPASRLVDTSAAYSDDLLYIQGMRPRTPTGRRASTLSRT